MIDGRAADVGFLARAANLQARAACITCGGIGGCVGSRERRLYGYLPIYRQSIRMDSQKVRRAVVRQNTTHRNHHRAASTARPLAANPRAHRHPVDTAHVDGIRQRRHHQNPETNWRRNGRTKSIAVRWR